MELLRTWGYGYGIGSFPLVVIVGFAAFALILTAALLTALKPVIPPLRRLRVATHRRLAAAGILLGAVHLAMALSAYL